MEIKECGGKIVVTPTKLCLWEKGGLNNVKRQREGVSYTDLVQANYSALIPSCERVRQKQTSWRIHRSVFAHSFQKMSLSMPYIEKFHGPVNKVEEYILHGTNGKQMWNNGFNNIFCSSNVFIFHSSSGGGQFYAALPSARSACKSMSIKATECSYVTGSSFHQFCSRTDLSLCP